MPRDIDFRYAPPVVQTCIGFVDDPHKTIVREDGSLNYGYGHRPFPEREDLDGAVTLDTAGFRHRLRPTFSHRDALEDRTQTCPPGAAVVTTTETYADTTFEWTAFAHRTDDCSADVVRWTLSTDEGFGRAPSEVSLELDGDPRGAPEIVAVDPLGADEGHRAEPTLRGGETHEGAFVVVLDGDPGDVTLEWVDDALERTREYWNDVTPLRNALRVPDGDVNDMLVACGRNILQAREVRDGVPEFQVGPTDYRGLWIVDGHFLLEAAHMMGRGDEAFEQGLIGVLRRSKPSGAIQNTTTTTETHYKETAIAMKTVVRQCELADDDDRLAELWPFLRRGLEFLEELHAEAGEMGPDYPARSLFPPALLDGGIAGPFPEYTTPLWVLAGVKHAAEAGERLDLPGHERFDDFYEEIRAGFEECAQRDMRETDDGITYLPMNMEHRAYDNPQSATWAFAHAIYPGQVFDPDGEYVENLLDLLDAVDDEQGIPKNTGWIHDQGVWTYSAMFYGQAWLYAGYPEKAVEYLYAFANHAGPTRTWREEQALRDTHSAVAWGDMPHNWASAEFVRMVRNLLVFERDGDLHLLPGLPAEWLPGPDDPLHVEATPTRFGPVDLELEADGGDYALRYDRGEGNQEPAAVRVHWDGAVDRADGPVETGDGPVVLPGGCRGASLDLAAPDR